MDRNVRPAKARDECPEGNDRRPSTTVSGSLEQVSSVEISNWERKVSTLYMHPRMHSIDIGTGSQDEDDL